MNTKELCIILGLALSVTGCSTQKDKSDSDITEHMVGAYTGYRAVSSEEKALFENTYKGEIKLTPVKVATQVVAGTNYSFVCKETSSSNSEIKGKSARTYEVVIYQPLPGQGNPEVSSVTEK